jgi:hypothetical protein
MICELEGAMASAKRPALTSGRTLEPVPLMAVQVTPASVDL